MNGVCSNETLFIKTGSGLHLACSYGLTTAPFVPPEMMIKLELKSEPGWLVKTDGWDCLAFWGWIDLG